MKVFSSALLGPFFSAGVLFSFLSLPFFLFFVFALLGSEGLGDKSRSMAAALMAAIATLPVWALLNLVLAPFRVWRAERSSGAWQGTRFVCHERQHAYTCEWAPEDNGGFRDFRFPDAPKGALVDYVIEIEGRSERVRCLAIGNYYFWPIEPLLRLWWPSPRGKAQLRRGRVLRLYCHALPNTMPAIIRTYVLAWDIRPTILFEYTDRKSDSRMIVRGPDLEEQAGEQL